ncbi:MAG: FAD-dependent oxidoreductase [Vicinamibacterales bacterium]
MAVTQKLACVVERVVSHGERVYSVALRPERPLPRFRAGQFLHLALDPYDPTGFWPESRVFSIASSPAQRDRVRLTYAVHGRYTERMEREISAGREVWIKMPYGDFVVEPGADVMLFAGGTGVTAFTAFLEGVRRDGAHAVKLAYGARTSELLIYRDVVEHCAVDVSYFVEQTGAGDPAAAIQGRVTVAAMWPRIERPFDTAYYISGPPAMLRSIGDDLRARRVAAEAIHIDAWE